MVVNDTGTEAAPIRREHEFDTCGVKERKELCPISGTKKVQRSFMKMFR